MRGLTVVCVLLIALAPGAGAQSAAGTITGTVRDATGAVLPAVSIKAVNTGTGLSRQVMSGESGVYVIPQLPVGTYRLEAELPGFCREVRTGITLQVNQRAGIDITLQIGEATEVIHVTGEASLLQTEDSSLGSVIDRRKVTELPLNGRHFESLVQLVPGAVTAPQTSDLGQRGGFVVAGLDEHYQSFYVDGMDNVDTVIRNFAYRPSIDVIEEFKVQSTGYSAEFGRNAGAVINVTTRSGGNEFHGAVWNYHRNNKLDKQNFFAPAGEDPGFLRNQFGATLGGPIVRDKTFFFAAYEGLGQRQQITRRAAVPSAAARSGDLSELVSSTTGSALCGSLAGVLCDPATGTPFPGNVIPLSRWAKLSAEALAFWPEPNQPGPRLNLVTSPSKIDNYDNVSIKFDQHLV